MLSVKDLLLWIFWNPFKYFLQKIPPKFTYFLARVMGIIYYSIAHDKKRRLQREFSFISGLKATGVEAKNNVREAFKIFLCSEFEMLMFPVLNSQNISKFVKCRGLENLDEALSHGKGAMLLFGHFGANQMVMPAIGYRKYKMCQLSAPATVWKEKMRHKQLSKIEEHSLKMRWEHEASLPVKHINIFGSLKEAFLCLKRNEVLGVAIDGGGGDKRVAVRFLHRKAFFSIGAIDIARRTDCAILPTFMLRTKKGYNILNIEPRLLLDPVDDIDGTIKKTTQLFVKRLEAYVLKYPSHYLNFLALRRLMTHQGDQPFFEEKLLFTTNDNSVTT
jgi:KDO2-lipid IV(A) lauroyltransferase